MSNLVACLDVWTPAVREIVLNSAPAGLELRFADSYDEQHQTSLVENADILLPGWAAVTEQMLARAKRLRMIQKWGIGVDRIDVAAVQQRGILLAITSGSNAGPVAELALALMLTVYRRLVYVNRMMRLGKWPKAEMRETCFQISGKTIGLVGFGNIGRMLARRLRGFDIDLLYVDTYGASAEVEQDLRARRVTLGELLHNSDIVSLHAPLSSSTERLIDEHAIQAMKDGAILINTSRGELIDEAALVAALRTGKLRGAGLDAFSCEPLPVDSPLLDFDQVVVSPHAGGGVLDNVENVALHAFGNITRFLAGASLAPTDVIVPGKVN